MKHLNKKIRIILAFCTTFAFLLGISLFLFFNEQKSNLQFLGEMSPFLAVPFCYTAYKCLGKVKMRALYFAAFYSLLLCAFAAISFSYMTLNTFIIKVENIVAIVLTVPLVSVYVQRFLLIFDGGVTKGVKAALKENQEEGLQESQNMALEKGSSHTHQEAQQQKFQKKKYKGVKQKGSAGADKKLDQEDVRTSKLGLTAAIKAKFSKLCNFAKEHPVKAFLILWLVMFVLWLPYLFAFWPSVWAFDAYYQSAWLLLRGGRLSAWHPVIHTLWLSLPVTASWHLFGSYIPGAVFYTITQMIALSWIFMKIISIIARWKISKVLPAALWLIIALFPIFPFWSVVATKDVIFSGLFALSCTCMADLIISIRNGNNPLKSKKYVFLLGLLFLLTALFRNNAIYAFVLLAVLLFIFGAKLQIGRVKPFFFLMAIAACYFCITGPVYSACGIISTSSKEALNVPLQQLATVAKQGNGITYDEFTFIKTYVPKYNNLKEKISDPIKNKFNASEFASNPIKFFVGYIKIGLAHPDIYTDAFFRMEINYVSPLGNDLYEKNGTIAALTPYAINRTSATDDMTKYIHIDEASLLPAFKEAIKTCLTGYAAQTMPLVSTLYQYGFWFWVLLLFLVLACYLRKNGFIFLVLFILCYWLTVMLGPVGWFRYALPLIFFVPVLISLFFYMKKSVCYHVCT